MIGNKIGKLGEDIAIMFLKKHNFDVLTRNYNRKWGEIDIVAKKDGITHFIEVKAVSRENLQDISRVTPIKQGFIRPEENLHEAKLKRLSRVIQTYLMENRHIKDWQFDLCLVYIDQVAKKAKVKIIEDLILPE